METVVVGEVLRTQGVQGELKVYPLTHDPHRFKDLREVILQGKGISKILTVQGVRITSDFVYLILDGIDGRDIAETYRGFEVRVARENVPPLPEGWYYFELEGLQVYEGEKYLGELTRVLETGANDVYLVQGPVGEICIPALKSVVLKVDIPGKKMLVSLPPGLIEDGKEK